MFGKWFVVLSFLLLLCINNSDAQINLKIGYELNNFQSSQNEMLTKAFNQQNSDILSQGKDLPELHYMNGLTLGFSYKTDFSRMEISWHTVFRTRDAFGETKVAPIESYDVYKRYNIRGFQLMYELLYKRVGIGATIGRDVIRMKSEIINSNNDKTITSQELYSAKFHVSLTMIENDRLSVVLRPFFTYYIDEFDHQPIYDFLEVPSTGINTKDRPYIFGLSLIFYNGLQKD